MKPDTIRTRVARRSFAWSIMALAMLTAAGATMAQPGADLTPISPDDFKPAATPAETAPSAAPAEIPGRDQLDFANGLFARKLFAEAADEYETYLREYPQSPAAIQANLRLGQAAQAAGRYEKALEAYERVAGSGSPEEQRAARLGRGECLFLLKRYQEAADTLAKLMETALPPDQAARALYYAGRARLELGDAKGAADAFRKITDTYGDQPVAPYARYQLAQALSRLGQDEEAAAAFAQVAGTTDADADLRAESRFRAAELYDRMGLYDAAATAYEQLRQAFPDSEYARRAAYGYAWVLFRAGRVDDAAAAARAFLDTAPAPELEAGTRYLQGECARAAQRYDEAIEQFQAVREKFKDTPYADHAWHKLAWTLYLKGDTAQAMAEARALLDSRPDGPLAGEAGYLLGLLNVATGNYEDARQEFRIVAEKFPDSSFAPDALFKAAECLEQLGLRDQAAKQYEEFVRKYPDNPLAEQALLKAGDAQFTAKDFEQAVAKYRDILARATNPATIAEARFRLAITCHNTRDFAGATEQFQQLLNTPEAARYHAEAACRLAEYALRDGGDPSKALELLQRADAANPSPELRGRIARTRAFAYYQAKDYSNAAEQFLKVITDFPGVPLPDDLYAWTAQQMMDAGKWDAAIKALEATLKNARQVTRPEMLALKIAECHEKAERPDKAMDGYRKLAESDGDPAIRGEARVRLGRLLEAAGSTDDAIAQYEAAVKGASGEPAARAAFRLGELYAAREQWEIAAKSFMRVAVLYLHETLSPAALWQAGLCFEKMGRAEDAAGAWSELVRDFPNAPEASQAQEALQRLQSKGGGQ
ncbi:MAG TPA: tetratricopeptide repeat protein [Candidatus Hydrogenedentes bacterium]|nr:tetratricopeptide repeat protein [Candidatus Hydrogenedentota bacterium]